MIYPTVGRKVWYRLSEHDKTGPIPMVSVTDQPLDATIIAVWGDRMVNVLIHDIFGKPFVKTSIKLLQDDDQPDRTTDGKLQAGYVEWMPYQTKQAEEVMELEHVPA